MNRLGRPKKDDSRNKQYRIRLNDKELEELDYVSNAMHKEKSILIREVIHNLYMLEKHAERNRE